jgi:putative ATPase
MAVWGARAEVADGALGEVPPRLRDASYRSAAVIGHGVGYEYPHAHEGGWVDQEYLPAELADRSWYHPTTHGREREIGEAIARRRRAEP